MERAGDADGRVRRPRSRAALPGWRNGDVARRAPAHLVVRRRRGRRAGSATTPFRSPKSTGGPVALDAARRPAARAARPATARGSATAPSVVTPVAPCPPRSAPTKAAPCAGVAPRARAPGRRAASAAARSARTTAGSRARSAERAAPTPAGRRRFVSGSVSASVTISVSPSAASSRRIRRAMPAIGALVGRRDRRDRGSVVGTRVVAAEARDLLDEVLLDLEVAAPRRRRDHAASALAPARACRARAGGARISPRGNAHAEQRPARARGRSADRARRRARRRPAPPRRRPAPRRRPRAARSAPAAASSAAGTPAGIDAALEAVGGLRRQPEPAAVRRTAAGAKNALSSSSVARRRRDLARLRRPSRPAMRDRRRARRRSPDRPPPSARSTPSSVTMRSPAARGARRSRRPRCAPRSKACSGWPRSSITKLVTSTTLLIGRMPARRSRRRSHERRRPRRARRARRARSSAGRGPAPRSRTRTCSAAGAPRLAHARPRRPRSGAPGQRRHLARDAEDRQAVAAVRRDLDLEHRVARRPAASRSGRARRGARGSSSTRARVVAEPELRLRAEHARPTPRRGSSTAARRGRPAGARPAAPPRPRWPAASPGAAETTVQRLARPTSTRQTGSRSASRMRLDGDQTCRHGCARRGRPTSSMRLDLEAGHRQALGERAGRSRPT